MMSGADIDRPREILRMEFFDVCSSHLDMRLVYYYFFFLSSLQQTYTAPRDNDTNEGGILARLKRGTTELYMMQALKNIKKKKIVLKNCKHVLDTYNRVYDGKRR